MLQTPLINKPISKTLPDDKTKHHKGQASRQSLMHSCFPIFEWLPRYPVKECLAKDLACGLTIGCVLIAQSLAHATLCGVSVVHGPYSCLLAPIVYALLGTCHQASVGTGGLVALLTGLQLKVYEDPDFRAHASAILCLLVGLIMAFMGIFQLSFLVRFLSRPALSGFITGSALLIMKSMTMPMLGLPKELADKGLWVDFFLEPENLLQCNKVTVGLSVVCYIFLSTLAKKIPSKTVRDFKELIVLVGSGIFCKFYGIEEGVAVVGAVPEGLPGLSWPITSMADVKLAKEMLPGASLIAVVTFISSFAAAKKCALKGGYYVVATNELMALGLGNAAGAFVGAVPTQIGLSRSALATGMGVKTLLGCNVFVAAIIAMIVLAFGPFLAFVPSCVLNCIIFNAATHLFEFDQLKALATNRDLWTAQKDMGIWVLAFAGTVVLGAFEGIVLAVVVSLLLAISEVVNPQIDILGQISDDLRWGNIKRFPEALQWNHNNPNKLVLRIDGPLFYANSERFQDSVNELEMSMGTDTPFEIVVLSASSISFIDATAINILQDMAKSWKERGILFFIANAYGDTRLLMERQLADVLHQTDLSVTIDTCMALAQAMNKEIEKEAEAVPVQRTLTSKADEEMAAPATMLPHRKARAESISRSRGASFCGSATTTPAAFSGSPAAPDSQGSASKKVSFLTDA